MFQDLQRYDRYVSNNSPWLGDLPSHWSTQRTKSLLFERSQKGFPDEPLLASTQSHGVILKSDYATRTVTATKDLHLLKLVEVGDFVISLRSFQGGIERCHHRGIISPAYTVLTAKSDKYRDYLTYLFKSKPFVDSLTLSVTGIREGQNIDYATLAVDLLPVPPVDEQTAIVKYLAHANARITKAITAKRRLIALLEEQKHVDWEALVRGSNCEDQSPTGIPWFPEAPIGWDVIRVKRVLNGIEQGWSPQCDAQPADNDEWGVMKAGCANHLHFRSEDNKRLPTALTPKVELEIRHGDLLVNRANTRDLVGSAAVALRPRPKLIFSDKMFRLLTRADKVDNEFLALAMSTRSARDQIESRAVGASNSMQNISQGVIRDLWIGLPSISEQRAIADRVKSSVAELGRATATIRHEIALLQEFRTRLVADVVTGQVDVRAVAATLPDAVEAGADAVEEDVSELDEGLVDAAEGDDV